MSRNQNRLLNTQRTSITNRVLKGVGGTILLSMLIFGALSVNDQADVAESQASQSNQNTASQLSSQQSATGTAVESTASLAEVEATESVATVDEVEEVAESSANQSVQEEASVARTASVTGTQSTAASTSAVQFAAVQSSLNASGTAGLVSWSTMMEQNSKSFIIERSLDGESFETLGKVAAQGAGKHQSRKDYQFEDASLGMTQMPRVFYRVKQVGLDGKTHLTDMVEYDLGLDLGLYAAVMKDQALEDQIKIRYAGDQEGEMTLRIFKPSGELMIQQDLASDFSPRMIAVETAGWDKGTYFLQLANEETSLMEQFSLQ